MNASRWIALGLWFLVASAQSVRAEVVFGNFGSDGSGEISNSGTAFSTALFTKSLAIGFTTGTDPVFLKLQSVTLGFFATDTGTQPRSVSIFSNASGNPGTSLVTSGIVNVGDDAKYTFPFSNYQLSANQTYWIVPEGPSFWSLSFDEEPATGLNGSGWGYAGARRITTTSAGEWVSASFNYSASVVAVPEPSTIALGFAGVAGLAGFRLRRRMTWVG